VAAEKKGRSKGDRVYDTPCLKSIKARHRPGPQKEGVYSTEQKSTSLQEGEKERKDGG